jgi:hypothetical protein
MWMMRTKSDPWFRDQVLTTKLKQCSSMRAVFMLWSFPLSSPGEGVQVLGDIGGASFHPSQWGVSHGWCIGCGKIGNLCSLLSSRWLLSVAFNSSNWGYITAIAVTCLDLRRLPLFLCLDKSKAISWQPSWTCEQVLAVLLWLNHLCYV